MRVDKLDRQILAILMENANTPFSEIANKLFVSGGTIHVRMRKLKQLGIVKGSTLTVDYSKLGYDITAFLGIYLDKSSLYHGVLEQMLRIPEITGAHYTTGQYTIFATIVCRDTNHLREVLHDKIQNIEGIQRTETFISLEESIDRSIRLLTDEEAEPLGDMPGSGK